MGTTFKSKACVPSLVEPVYVGTHFLGGERGIVTVLYSARLGIQGHKLMIGIFSGKGRPGNSKWLPTRVIRINTNIWDAPIQVEKSWSSGMILYGA